MTAVKQKQCMQHIDASAVDLFRDVCFALLPADFPVISFCSDCISKSSLLLASRFLSAYYICCTPLQSMSILIEYQYDVRPITSKPIPTGWFCGVLPYLALLTPLSMSIGDKL